MGYPGNPKAPPVAKAIEEALARIVAAGHTPGMPATHNTLPEVLLQAKGCRYIYTHIAAPPRHRRRRVPEAVARKLQFCASEAFTLYKALAYASREGIPIDLDTTPGRALKCRHRPTLARAARSKKTPGGDAKERW